MIDFIYIDRRDGTGGFMIPKGPRVEDVIDELLKDPEYILRDVEDGEER